jgi:3-methyl-2-oxobutanoate hydroxymethyltransferase
VSDKWTTAKIRKAKGRERIVCLTAHDYSTARILDAAGVELILVGDSLAMTALGYSSTLPVTMREMLHHTAAVARAARTAMVVGDMPFMSYQVSSEQALRNAARFVKTAGADAVKLEGGAIRAGTIRLLTSNGIPVLGHIGLTPQSVREMGGYRVQGRQPEQAKKLLDDARAVEEAGAFAVVIECVPAGLGGKITETLGIPTVGIGAGPLCDGQILVTNDILGLYDELSPKFAKRYAEIGAGIAEAVRAYGADVREGRFPGPEHCFS